MQQIEFFGASGDEVTGSNYLLTGLTGYQVLIDFGMFQGSDVLERKNYDRLLFDPSSLKGVFLTHAHLDHCGRLPLLIYGGYNRKIFMTEPTRTLVEIILSDSARIAELDKTRNPLYTMDEVDKILKMIEVVSYGDEVDVRGFRAVFFDAGHILGSSSIVLSDTESHLKFAFSGDLGNTPQPLVKPTAYIPEADVVVMESTYGDSDHPKEDAAEIIREEMNAIEKTGGVLLIPAFAIERTQEVLHIIHHLKKDGKVRSDTPVFLDSPMGTTATEAYLEFDHFLNDEMRSHGEDIPFNFEGLVITEEARDSKEIMKSPAPKVIVAGSGMMSGGRILHHAANYLSDPNTRLLFVGYQGEDTMGREILEGAKNVRIEKQQIPVRAHIREIKVLSSHADQTKLLEWLRHVKGVKKVFLTHGEKSQREVLAEKIRKEFGIKEVYLPKDQEEFSLSIS